MSDKLLANDFLASNHGAALQKENVQFDQVLTGKLMRTKHWK